MRTLLVWVCLIGIAGTACGQSAAKPTLAVPTSATSDQIRDWFRQNDPRMIAWGATFARDQKDDAVVGDMIHLLRLWRPDYGWRGRPMQDTAMWLVLDALIQRNIKVPADAIDSVAQSFPAAAAILISRISYDEAMPVLQKWYGDGVGEDKTRLQKIAAMMLAKNPPAGFAASVLQSSKSWLWVDVYSAQPPKLEGQGSGTCGDAFGKPDAPGWPPAYFYYLEEGSLRQVDGPAVVEIPGDRVTYKRHLLSQGWGSCHGVSPLSPYSRHRLLAVMAGVADNLLSWKVREWEAIKWSNPGQFQGDLNAAVERREKAFRGTMDALHAKGLLTDAEAQSTRPVLLVYIHDARTTPGTIIPQPVFKSSRTFWSQDPPPDYN